MKNTTTEENPIYEKPLKQGHSLTILDKNGSDVVQVRNAQGLTLFTIEITEQGTNLNIEAKNINLVAEDKLNLSANEVTIDSRKKTILASMGDLESRIIGNHNTEVKGDSLNIAKTHLIKASLGDVKLQANDDIKLNGERVKLNCDL